MKKREYTTPVATVMRVTTTLLAASQTIEFTDDTKYADPNEEVL